jgi:beta-catenin-like protein 1
MDNLFNSLCSSLNEASIKRLFLDAEGLDLMILMIKSVFFVVIMPFKTSQVCREKLQSKSRSIKVLDYAMSGPGGTPVCEAFVEALGLRALFTAFMGKVGIQMLTFNNFPPL